VAKVPGGSKNLGVVACPPDGHCLQDRGTTDVAVLEVGSRIPGEAGLSQEMPDRRYHYRIVPGVMP
jgi:uncharacterized cupin superfamily protein